MDSLFYIPIRISSKNWSEDRQNQNTSSLESSNFPLIPNINRSLHHANSRGNKQLDLLEKQKQRANRQDYLKIKLLEFHKNKKIKKTICKELIYGNSVIKGKKHYIDIKGTTCLNYLNRFEKLKKGEESTLKGVLQCKNKKLSKILDLSQPIISIQSALDSQSLYKGKKQRLNQSSIFSPNKNQRPDKLTKVTYFNLSKK